MSNSVQLLKETFHILGNVLSHFLAVAEALF